MTDIEKIDATITDEMLEAYAEKWIKIGTAVKKLDHERAIAHMKRIYASQGAKEPEHYLFFRSPNEICREGAKLEAPDETGEKHKERVRELISECIYGQQDAVTVGRLDLFRELYGMKAATEEAVPYIEAAPDLHWVLMFQNVCLFSEFPEFAKFDDEGNLHADNGPAVRYADGMELHSLWGVNVPEWVANTSPAEMDIEKILAIEDVDVRTVALRKYGIHRAKDKLKVEVLDSDEEGYELWTYEIEGARVGPALKMVNPTTGEIHVEGVGEPGGVDESIKTIQQAHEFRDERRRGKECRVLFRA
jgi:hypothetical protein